MEQFDLLVVGGGINGAGIARDAAGRGLSVMLVEKDDLAAHTSSASSKLIHGGLRYLEQLDFKLVRESLAERERLLRAAPHIVEPLEFVIPVVASGRSAWKLRVGLFLYDHLGGRQLLPASRSVQLDGDEFRSVSRKGLSYWDCRVQDSRLVVLNAVDAAERGATISTRTELIHASRNGGGWVAALRGPSGERMLEAKALVNAAGAWATELLARIKGARQERALRLVKGSHIVVPRLYRGQHAYLLQNVDRRVVFAIPFEGFTLVGTTDVDWNSAPAQPTISGDEIDYLLGTISRNFTTTVTSDDIVWSYSGLRALWDDGAPDPSKVTRDYRLRLDDSAAPLLNVFGGKITTYRLLAEQTVGRLAAHFPAAGHAWTETAVLPGGEIADLDIPAFVGELVAAHPELPEPLLSRLARTYGTRVERLLEGVASSTDLGQHFGADLYAREVDYLVAHEWAQSADDILWRRTKLGLHVTKNDVRRLADYIAALD